MRSAVAVLAGGLFGAGLLVSGMTDADRVRGFLMILGPEPWQPALALVMGGAILPMAVAWRVAAGTRFAPGGTVPPAARALDRRLIGGAVLFGIAWGLIGLCPGPALAALLWGGWPVALFAASMVAAMVAMPPLMRAVAR